MLVKRGSRYQTNGHLLIPQNTSVMIQIYFIFAILLLGPDYLYDHHGTSEVTQEYMGKIGG